MTAVMVVTFFPMILHPRPQDASWCGSVVLLLAVIALIAAFFFAGLVAAELGASSTDCARLPCSTGGIPCTTDVLSFGQA